MVPPPVAEGEDDLLEVAETLVDVPGLVQLAAIGARLLRALRTGQIDEVKLREDESLGTLDPRARLDVQRKDGVGAGGVRVELVRSVSTVRLSLEQLLESVLFGQAVDHAHVLDGDAAARVILDREGLGSLADILGGCEQVHHLRSC